MWLLEDSMKAPSGEGSGAICAGHEALVGELEGEVEWQHSHDWRLYPEYGQGYGGTGLELCGQRDGYVDKKERERMCVCVCVCERERERFVFRGSCMMCL